MSAIRILADVFENQPDYIKLRVENPNKQVATVASLTGASPVGISYRVIEYSTQEEAEDDENGTEILGATSLVVADVIFDTPIGGIYNFEFLSPGTNRPNGNKWCKHQITFTPASGPAYMSVTLNKVLPVND
jgi:hypothetical protein